MVEDNIINEFAVILNRTKSQFELVEQFVPVRVVEGYFYEDEECFIDADQNVYSHIASLSTIGNVFLGRTSIIEILNKYKDMPLTKIKQKILSDLSKYEFFKNVDETSDEYCHIKMRDKETGDIYLFSDKDTVIYYEMYSELNQGKNISKEHPKEITNNSTTIEREEKASLTPDDIIKLVKNTIKGQDEAIETIVTLLWVKYNLPMINKTNMLVFGPSGVGKTAIFKKIKEILDIPLSIYSVTGTSQAGYKGHDIEEMLAQLYFDAGMDIEKAENGIVVIDEFDKISNNRDNGEIGTTAIQNELLKLIEGCERAIPLDNHTTVNMDTSNIIFVGCGAFSNLFEEKTEKRHVIGFNSSCETKTANQSKVDTEMLVEKGGIIRELAGRLPVIIQLNDLNNDKVVLKDILLNSDESCLYQIIESLHSIGIEIENVDSVVDNLVENAIKKQIGARGLIGSSMNMFLKVFKEIGNNPNKYNKLIIGENIIDNPNDFELLTIKKKTKKKINTTQN